MRVLNTSSDRPQVAAREAYDYMANHVARFNCLQALLVVKQNISHRLRILKENNWHFTQETILFPFPFLIDLIVRHCTTMIPVAKFTESELVNLMDKYVNYSDPLLLCQDANEGRKRSNEYRVKMSFEQVRYQEATFSLFPRCLLLFQDVPDELIKCYHQENKYRLFAEQCDRALQSYFKLSLEDILICGSALDFWFSENHFWSDDPGCEEFWLKEYVKSDRVHILAQHLTITREEYRTRQWLNENDYLSRKYENFPIFKFPIVEVEGKRIAPFPKLISERVTKLLYKDFYDFYEANEMLKDFGGSYGGIFEHYVGMLLRSCFGKGNVLHADEMFKGDERKADWIVIRDQTALLFECKILRYPPDLKNTGSLTVLAQFFEKEIIPKLEQCKATEDRLKGGYYSNLIPSSINDFYYIVVAEEHFEQANTVQDYLADCALVEKLNSYKWQLMSMLDLEQLESDTLHDDIQTVFVDKWCDLEARKASFQQHISVKGGNRMGNSLMARKFRELFHLPDNWRNENYPLH